ncbi:MAG TPA: 3' terminal RNA ribose 2'-O-methyltransferase Hen1 [Planctomycetaceae bacterium]|nr:3' terminal RNA ribose 2'-O-methyltransferase Hen1 [Planctomycetaceae bacterium]
MLLTLATTHRPATDLGFLLHKHPDRFQSFDLSFGKAHVFYPEAGPDRCTACLLLDVDPVGMVRRQGRPQSFRLGHYVNDRPYVASSFLSVALSQVFGTALGGRCKDRPELAATPIPLSARIEVLPVRGGEGFLHRVFEPLGYAVEATRHPLDERFPEWGESPYFSVTIRGTKTLAELLTHLYVLVPVFDNEKHYYVGEDELEKLLRKGSLPSGGAVERGGDDSHAARQPDAEIDPLAAASPASGWLAAHPERDQITRRYLKHRSSLYREALARLVEEEQVEPAGEDSPGPQQEAALETLLSLNEQRHAAVLASLRASGARSVLDLGCGEGKLLRQLLEERQFERIVGMDVSVQALQRAVQRLGYERLPPIQRQRIELIHGSLIYRDRRLAGFDAAAVVEVIEHLDPPRLSAFERVLFEFARPETVVLTTPNREYNVMWESLPAGQFRHADHRFEWTRAEFQTWAGRIALQYGYSVRFLPVGPEDERVGAPTQMGIFKRGSV